jgi:hypothetical protein
VCVLLPKWRTIASAAAHVRQRNPAALHPAGRGDPQQIQTLGDGPTGQVAQGKSAGSDLIGGLQHWAVLVETCIRARDSLQVDRELVELQRLSDLVDNGGESEQFQRKRPLGGVPEPESGAAVGSDLAFTED